MDVRRGQIGSRFADYSDTVRPAPLAGALATALAHPSGLQLGARDDMVAQHRWQTQTLVLKERRVVRSLSLQQFCVVQPGHHRVVDPVAFPPGGARISGDPLVRRVKCRPNVYFRAVRQMQIHHLKFGFPSAEQDPPPDILNVINFYSPGERPIGGPRAR